MPAHCTVGLAGLGPLGFQSSPSKGGRGMDAVPFCKMHMDAQVCGYVCVSCVHVLSVCLCVFSVTISVCLHVCDGGFGKVVIRGRGPTGSRQL